MTWDDLRRAVLSALVGTLVSTAWGLYLRHLAKLNRDELLRLLSGIDSITTIKRKGPRMANLRQYRKALGAGTGSLLGGLLVYVETNDLDPVLGPLVPDQWRPLVGWVVGAVVVVLSVIAATNDPKPQPSEPAPTLEDEAPPTSQLAASAAPLIVEDAAAVSAPAPSVQLTTAAVPPTVSDPVPYWAGIKRAEPSDVTSLVELLPAPQRTYQ